MPKFSNVKKVIIHNTAKKIPTKSPPPIFCNLSQSLDSTIKMFIFEIVSHNSKFIIQICASLGIDLQRANVSSIIALTLLSHKHTRLSISSRPSPIQFTHIHKTHSHSAVMITHTPKNDVRIFFFRSKSINSRNKFSFINCRKIHSIEMNLVERTNVLCSL